MDFQLTIILLSLLSLSPVALSARVQEREVDFERWLSWNAHHYNMKRTTESLMAKSGNNGSSLDMILRNAEMEKERIVVSQDGSGNFTTISEAIASIPKHNKRRVEIEIKPGLYREKIVINKTRDFITLVGDPLNPPTITGNDSITREKKTYDTATFAVNADYFIAINIKFENTLPHFPGKDTQAVAFRASGNKTAFYNCSFYGWQDTLYDHKGFHYFNNCFIQGSVDFICGYGRTLYENCHVNSIAENVSSITAQKRNLKSLSSGFSFKNCKITGTGKVYLGRAWGNYSRVVFSYTYMDNLILPEGWSPWNWPTINIYYGEYKCSGPGANRSGRVPWARMLTAEEATPFAGTYFVDGDTWLTNH
ncbi:Pectinesterase, catalytic [Dillenia turbinata]|uniref:pectinesterase n=1 Tax=Dillenia turbinata TaxID=194707 RepID=A0AAN8W0K3_9MAGN